MDNPAQTISPPTSTPTPSEPSLSAQPRSPSDPLKRPPKGLILALLAVGAVSLGATVGFFYLQFSRPSDSGQTPTPAPKASPTTIPTPTPSPEAKTDSGCITAGCSGTVCIDEITYNKNPFSTTCEYRLEHACYKLTTCTRLPSGDCGWKQTPVFTNCLKNPPPDPSNPNSGPVGDYLQTTIDQAASARDRQRQSDLFSITNAIFQYATEHGGKLPSGMPMSTPTCIGSASPCYDLASVDNFVPTFLDSMRFDPSTGSLEDTKYLISITEQGRIVMSATGELTATIDLTR